MHTTRACGIVPNWFCSARADFTNLREYILPFVSDHSKEYFDMQGNCYKYRISQTQRYKKQRKWNIKSLGHVLMNHLSLRTKIYVNVSLGWNISIGIWILELYGFLF